MAKYLLMGKYTLGALKGISADRTKEAMRVIERSNGKVSVMYALLGDYDIILIVDFKDNSEAMKASISLANLTGISFSTYPAVTVQEFDKIADK